MKKTIIITGSIVSALFLGACSSDVDKEVQVFDEIETGDVIMVIDKDIEIKGSDLKNQIDDIAIASMMDLLIEKKVVIDSYPVKTKELKEKAIEMGLNYDELNKKELLDLKYNVSYEKGLHQEFDPSEEQLNEIYNSFYAQTGASLADVEEEVYDMAAQILGRDLFDQMIAIKVENVQIEFKNKELEDIYKQLQ